MKNGELKELLNKFPDDTYVVFSNHVSDRPVNFVGEQDGVVRLTEISNEQHQNNVAEAKRQSDLLYWKGQRFENGGKAIALILVGVFLIIQTPLSVLLAPWTWGWVNIILTALVPLGAWAFVMEFKKAYKTVKELNAMGVLND